MTSTETIVNLIEKYRWNVPRYTSYPTAPHFTPEVNDSTYSEWLSNISEHEKTSLYLHIPFCKKLCWFCGCSTKIVSQYQAVLSYLDRLMKEIDLIIKRLPKKLCVENIHFGGGSPSVLLDKDFIKLMTTLRNNFNINNLTETAVELEPRTLSPKTISTYVDLGVT